MEIHTLPDFGRTNLRADPVMCSYIDFHDICIHAFFLFSIYWSIPPMNYYNLSGTRYTIQGF